ncbi:phosphatidylglycerophosphatase A [Mesobacterium pallidum]|uniref:phosphatidylglycerophosphatase A family protein n=1 Tax=Mesobacterium pallidum TaxID=2872037 RepID=UPI001EE270DC|nr:phosphatidylglycerophosphatase A [Mesobacterium pallidum]
MTHLIATFFYAGHLRPAPGTWGSLAALIVAYPLLLIGGPLLLVVGVLLAFGLGLWATGIETRSSDDHDPSEIVIDEVAGQWIALLPIAFGAANNNVPLTALWPGWVAAFVFFRLFDIWKPGPVGWADRRGDAMGVMLDDVIAGIFAAIVVVLLAGLYHGVLMQ